MSSETTLSGDFCATAAGAYADSGAGAARMARLDRISGLGRSGTDERRLGDGKFRGRDIPWRKTGLAKIEARPAPEITVAVRRCKRRVEANAGQAGQSPEAATNKDSEVRKTNWRLWFMRTVYKSARLGPQNQKAHPPMARRPTKFIGIPAPEITLMAVLALLKKDEARQ